MIDISGDNRKKTDYYFHFKKKEDVNSYIIHETVPGPRFKAEDYIDYATGNIEHNAVSHHDTHKLSIRTIAMIEIKNNDFFFDIKYRIVWRLDSIGVSDDGQMKELSLRPRKETILNLVR